jgi:GrpB-like predicted nucleotidyltransferase (UPF0157 family)
VIVICDYDPLWPTEFEAIRAVLAETLGDLALKVDHIGSTSVPGLGAKDVIDIQITVKSLTQEIFDRMIANGYQQMDNLKGIVFDHVPPGESDDPSLWQKFLFVQPKDHRRANIHIRMLGNPNQLYPLLFRDYLRAHPNSARVIEKVKRELARYHGDDLDAYYDIKDPVYDLIWEAAKEWSKQTNWKP